MRRDIVIFTPARGSLQSIRSRHTSTLTSKEARHDTEDEMRTIASTLLALSVLAGIAGKAYADDPSPNDTKQFYGQLDREGRGGQGNGN